MTTLLCTSFEWNDNNCIRIRICALCTSFEWNDAITICLRALTASHCGFKQRTPYIDYNILLHFHLYYQIYSKYIRLYGVVQLCYYSYNPDTTNSEDTIAYSYALEDFSMSTASRHIACLTVTIVTLHR